MSKNEFLQALGGKLKEELTTDHIEEHLKYYNDYIKQETSIGKSEQEVIDSLGDPILLARTILDTANSKTSNAQAFNANVETDRYQDESYEDIYQEEDARQQQANPINFNVTSGWGCLVVAMVAILIVGLILWLLGIVLNVLAPILVPVLIVLFVLTLFKRRH